MQWIEIDVKVAQTRPSIKLTNDPFVAHMYAITLFLMKKSYNLNKWLYPLSKFYVNGMSIKIKKLSWCLDQMYY